jgi:hypothetical protein
VQIERSDLVFCEIFDIDQTVARTGRGGHDLVRFQMDHLRIRVLRPLERKGPAQGRKKFRFKNKLGNLDGYLRSVVVITEAA